VLVHSNVERAVHWPQLVQLLLYLYGTHTQTDCWLGMEQMHAYNSSLLSTIAKSASDGQMTDHAGGRQLMKTSPSWGKLYDLYLIRHYLLYSFWCEQVQHLTSILHSDARIETTLPKQSDLWIHCWGIPWCDQTCFQRRNLDDQRFSTSQLWPHAVCTAADSRSSSDAPVRSTSSWPDKTMHTQPNWACQKL